MSLRYVWSKWDKSTKTTYSKLETNITETGVKNLASYSVISLTVYKSATVNSTTGAITLSNEQTILTSKITSGYSSWTYDVYFTGSDNKYYFGRVRDAFYSGNNAYTIDCFATKSVTAKATTSTIKGSTQYDNVSGTQNAYNSNGVTGDYWYVLLGSDTIDPSALTMTGEVKAGSTVTLTITPSATIAYGGTVTYTVQTTTDGENWYDAGTTTDTTMTLTVPEAAAWNARVIASDDTGFTSTDYVYANGSEDLVSVINVGFIPKSGWIGYKNSKNLLIVSATGKAGETVNISASLDGTQVITGSTTSDVSYQLALTDEQFNAVTEGESHTLTVTAQYATSGTSETRTYTFRKFTYDETSEGGVMEGAARAIREKNGSESTILGAKIPYEIIQIGAGGTTLPEDVRAGKTFFTEEGWKTGTNNSLSAVFGSTTLTVGGSRTITLPSGYKGFFVQLQHTLSNSTAYGAFSCISGTIRGSNTALFSCTKTNTSFTLQSNSANDSTATVWYIYWY